VRPVMFATTALPDATSDTALFLSMTSRPAEDGPTSTGLTIRGPLGRGGMAEVLRAEQPAFCRDIALKRLTLEGTVARAAFLSEARIMGLLDHAAVVPVHAWIPNGEGPPLLAMKLVEGRSWREILAERRCPTEPPVLGQPDVDLRIEEHVRTLLAVCRCVEAAHDRSILHRDLKPDNVMIGRYGQVYVMDWGIGVTTDRRLAAETGILHLEDAPGPAGTPAYMAPELAEGTLAQDARTDIYLLGAILHEIATGRPLHQGPDLDTLRKRCVAGEREPAPSWVPPELVAVIARATATAPCDRFNDVRELIVALEDFLAHREARALLLLADEGLAKLRHQIARAASTPSPDAARGLHATFTEVVFAASRAKTVWASSPEPARLQRAASSALLDHAIQTRQLALAERIAPDCEDPVAASDAVRSLRVELAALESELHALRDANRRLDFTQIGRPLGLVFAITGLLGLAAAFVSAHLLATRPPHAMELISLSWVAVTLVPGALARVLLRRHALPNSLASPRVFGLWAAVALGCTLHGGVSWYVSYDAFRDIHNQAAMLGIGFVAMGLQTRRWLLWPGAACFLSAVAMGLTRGHSITLFGAMWFIVMTSVGLAFRLGATLESDAHGTGSS
jgi:eukaryotic-like serine/threonine-protein kinase